MSGKLHLIFLLSIYIFIYNMNEIFIININKIIKYIIIKLLL